MSLALWEFFWSTAAWVVSTAPATSSQWLINTNQIVPPLVTLR